MIRSTRGYREMSIEAFSRSRSPIKAVRLRPRKVRPLPATLSAIADADLITLGPGSLFTSVIPNLLVEGIPQAIANSPALKAYFVNLMWQPGETTNFRASDHVAAMLRHAGRANGRSLIDVCVINNRPIAGKVLARYKAQEARPVENDIENLEKMGFLVLQTDLVRMAAGRSRARSQAQKIPVKIRHDPGAIGAIALELALQGRHAKLRLTS